MNYRIINYKVDTLIIDNFDIYNSNFQEPQVVVILIRFRPFFLLADPLIKVFAQGKSRLKVFSESRNIVERSADRQIVLGIVRYMDQQWNFIRKSNRKRPGNLVVDVFVGAWRVWVNEWQQEIGLLQIGIKGGMIHKIGEITHTICQTSGLNGFQEHLCIRMFQVGFSKEYITNFGTGSLDKTDHGIEVFSTIFNATRNGNPVSTGLFFDLLVEIRKRNRVKAFYGNPLRGRHVSQQIIAEDHISFDFPVDDLLSKTSLELADGMDDPISPNGFWQ